MDLRCLAADRPSLVLVGTVSSRRLIVESSIRARSGLADVVLMLDGMVAGGKFEARRLGRSAYSSEEESIWSLMLDTSWHRTESCLQV